MKAVILSENRVEKIKDVIHTLQYGLLKGWTSPNASLWACIDVLSEVKRSIPDSSQSKGEMQ